jgi:hydrogenase maturation protease
MKTLIVGLGNELLSDDGLGIIAARRLREEIKGRADVVECDLSGLALLDVLCGYEKAIIIDIISAGQSAPGAIVEINPDELRPIPNPSPHYSGLPEMIEIAGSLDIQFPRTIKILAVGAADPFTIGGGLSPPVAEAVNSIVDRVKSILSDWERRDVSGGNIVEVKRTGQDAENEVLFI